MLSVQTTGKKGTNAVRKLREQKLRNGLPFMINSKELATNECYLEYPDGSIKLAVVIPSTRDINIIRELSKTEADALRTRFNFPQKN